MSHADDGKLNALLDGELAPEEAASVEAHIAGCPECARRLAEARRFLTESANLLAALDLPGSAATARAPERRAPVTAKEIALDRGGATQGPALRPETGGAPRPVFARPPARARLDFTTLAWAATVVLAIGVGYLANEVRHGRAGDAYREGLAARTGEAQPGPAPASQTRSPAAPAPTLATAPQAAAGAGSATASRDAAQKPAAARPLPAAAALSRRENPVRRGKQLAGGAPADAFRPGAPAGRAAKTLALRDSAAAVGGVAAPAAAAEAAQAPANRAAMQTGLAAPAALAEQRLTAFRPAGLEEAVARLGGSIRLIDGMRIDSIEVGPGYRVSGAARDRDLVRIIYVDEQGRRIMLDQQRVSELSDTAAAGGGARERSDVGMVYGDTLVTAGPNAQVRVRWIDRRLFWLSLTASLPADSVRALVGRVR